MRSRSVVFWFLLVSLTFAALSCSRDPNVRKQKYLESGKRYLDAGKYREAGIQFANAIQTDPKFAEAHYQLSRAEIQEGEVQSAAYELNRSISLDPNHLRAHVTLGALLLVAGQRDVAEQHLETALRLDSNDVEAHEELARLRASQRNMNEAVKEIAKAIELNPKRAHSYLTRASLQAMQQQQAAEEDSLNQALQIDPTFLDAMLAYARLCESQQRWEQAEAWLRRAVEMHPQNLVPRLVLGGLLLRHNQPDRAEQVFAEVKKALPDNATAYNSLADFYLARNQADKATVELASLVKAHPKDNATAKRYISLLLVMTNYADAQTATDALLARDNKDTEGLVFRGRLLLHNGKVPEAVQTMETAVKRDRNNAVAHYWSGVAYNATGNLDRALVEWAEAARLNPRMIEAQRAVAMAATARWDRSTLRSTADKLITITPRSAEGYTFRAEAALMEKDVGAAVSDLKQASALDANNPMPPARWGDIEASSGRFTEAEKLYEESLRRNAAYEPALRGLVRIFSVQKQPAKALARIDAQLQRSPNDAAIYELKAMYLYANKNVEGSEEAALRAVELSKDNPEAILLLGRVQAASGSADKAAAGYEKVIQANPHDVRPYLLLGSLEQRRGNWSKAKQTYEKALQIRSDPVAANNLAYLLLENGGNVDTALSWAQVARAGLPTSESSADTLAWAFYHKGIYHSAIDLLEGAVRQNPDSALYQYHLGMSYKMAGDGQRAKEHLQRALSLDPKLGEAEAARKAIQS